MQDNIMVEIVERCLSIDKCATTIYQQLSSNAEEGALKAFWKDLAADGERHTAYWRKLIKWAGNGMLPQVFDQPQKILEELSSIGLKVEQLKDVSCKAYEKARAFLAAFKLEFYLLHPAFETLYQYLRTLSEHGNQGNAYDAHINKLFQALYKYDLATLELELLGETIHRLWQENRRMAIQSNDDPLTHVLNRRGLFNAIKPLSHLAQRNKCNVGIMMIDVDHFKSINDRFGHQFGDEVLKYVAKTIKSNIRASDVVGRYGGEEFLVFLSSVDPNALNDLGEKIRLFVKENNEKNARVTISIGLAQGEIGKEVEKELKALIAKADKNLLQAKNIGRDKVVI